MQLLKSFLCSKCFSAANSFRTGSCYGHLNTSYPADLSWKNVVGVLQTSWAGKEQTWRVSNDSKPYQLCYRRKKNIYIDTSIFSTSRLVPRDRRNKHKQTQSNWIFNIIYRKSNEREGLTTNTKLGDILITAMAVAIASVNSKDRQIFIFSQTRDCRG